MTALLIGLGNPGEKYLFTRHNAGFLVLDLIVERNEGVWERTDFDAIVGRVKLFGQECRLLKPMTYMNLSGKSVQKASTFWKIPPSEWIVLHDDIDVPAMKVKAKAGGGPGGHNGILSIIEQCGTDSFARVKLGVGKPVEEDRMDVRSWVLHPFKQEELELIKTVMYKDAMERISNIFKQRAKGA